MRAFAAEQGRADLPLCLAGLPVAPVFVNGPPADPRLAGGAYFVVCGTIEPRKNHMTLLDVWRDLAERLGPATPKLILVGKRGWHNENVLDLLERCAALRPHVIEASGLSTPALRSLLAGARAALAPSFGEGFGLPVAEAAACGAPVIASDIETFREIAADSLDYVDPLDGIRLAGCGSRLLRAGLAPARGGGGEAGGISTPGGCGIFPNGRRFHRRPMIARMQVRLGGDLSSVSVLRQAPQFSRSPPKPP